MHFYEMLLSGILSRSPSATFGSQQIYSLSCYNYSYSSNGGSGLLNFFQWKPSAKFLGSKNPYMTAGSTMVNEYIITCIMATYIYTPTKYH